MKERKRAATTKRIVLKLYTRMLDIVIFCKKILYYFCHILKLRARYKGCGARVSANAARVHIVYDNRHIVYEWGSSGTPPLIDC